MNSATMLNSVDELIEYAKKNPNLLLVIDESALSFDRYDPTQFWVAKTSRHNGHSSIFIGQNLTDIPKGVRTQCKQIFVFRTSRTDAKSLADEYDDDILLTATKLQDLFFIRILSGQKPLRGKVDYKKRLIFMESDNAA